MLPYSPFIYSLIFVNSVTPEFCADLLVGEQVTSCSLYELPENRNKESISNRPVRHVLCSRWEAIHEHLCGVLEQAINTSSSMKVPDFETKHHIFSAEILRAAPPKYRLNQKIAKKWNSSNSLRMKFLGH